MNNIATLFCFLCNNADNRMIKRSLYFYCESLAYFIKICYDLYYYDALWRFNSYDHINKDNMYTI